jgi:hypothetical protein
LLAAVVDLTQRHLQDFAYSTVLVLLPVDDILWLRQAQDQLDVAAREFDATGLVVAPSRLI